MINKNKKIDRKNLLIIGTGKWSKVLTNVFLKNAWNVSYATKDETPNIEFERYFSSRNLCHFCLSKPRQFDLISICVKPIDIFLVWKKYKYFSTTFLIEKPGANGIWEFSEILNEAKYEKKLIFINYEFNYSNITNLLKEKVLDYFNDIKSMKLVWEKPTGDEGGLEWRLLPHMLAELFFFNPNNLTFSKCTKNNHELLLDGFFNKSPISIIIKNSKIINHSTTINLINGNTLFKNREVLKYNDRLLARSSFSTLENVLQILNNSDNDIFNNNNLISRKVINLIEKINDI